MVEDIADEIDEADSEDEPVAVIRVTGILTSIAGDDLCDELPVALEADDDQEGG